jgi:SdpC family antimicrobial peptide
MMHSRKLTAWATSIVLAMAVSVGAPPAYGSGLEPDGGSRAVSKQSGFDSRIASASDRDLLTLLLTGTGPIANAHPELPLELGFPRVPMDVDSEALALVEDTFIERFPAFSTVWAPAIRSGDPIKINKGLNGFSVDFIEFVETDDVFIEFRQVMSNKPVRSARGDLVVVWNVAVVANAAVLATTVGVAATIAGAAMAIALVGGVFIAYLDDVEGANSSADMDRIRESTVKALAS